jgi:hypothetical protein
MSIGDVVALPFRRAGSYSPLPEGARFLIMKRSAAGPNELSQRIRDLTPGRLYSLKLYAWDAREPGTPQRHALSVKLADASLLADKTRHEVYNYALPARGGDEMVPVCFNYLYRVFRAQSSDARLTVSDWVSADDPGGPAGQELALDFVEIQPYLEE